ncbi:hypothetical protein ACFVHI_10655 [Kitasatospora sp. NPDC127121]|uniref:hypothetical protein n=1 Tax=Kitasatospora sp. NPDC127121 TaxID=3345371 RepID=UPI00363AFBA4
MVERLGQLGEFVVAGDGEAGVEPSLGEGLGGVAQGADGAQDLAGGEQGEAGGQYGGERAGAGGGGQQRAGGRLFAVQGQEGVDGQPGQVAGS